MKAMLQWNSHIMILWRTMNLNTKLNSSPNTKENPGYIQIILPYQHFRNHRHRWENTVKKDIRWVRCREAENESRSNGTIFSRQWWTSGIPVLNLQCLNHYCLLEKDCTSYIALTTMYIRESIKQIECLLRIVCTKCNKR
jgi:hypothetical protein